MDLEKDLDPEQLAAVRAVEGPVLVLAGAGSGKTRVLTYRVAHLLRDRGAPAVLAVTFTRKAAEEMRRRVQALIGGAPLRGWIGTFHAFAAAVLRAEGAAIGYPASYVIYDEDDQRRLLRRLLEDLGIPERVLSIPAAREEISGAKAVLLGPEEFGSEGGPGEGRDIAAVYTAYQQALFENRALDFDDLLRLAVRVFESHPDILERYRRRYPYVLVDEYQDTNHAQYRLVALLAGAHRNLCVVGDDDQSIYSWRGADVSNILDFEQEFPEATVVRLERSYRCPGRVLAGAQAVVAHNRRRKPKALWTPNPEGERIGLHLVEDERAEAEAVVAEVRDAALRGVSPHEVAVLYRTNAQSRALEDALRRAALPYVIVGSTRFYDRREIRDVLAYLKVIVNPADTVSLLRILNVPPRAVGEVTVERLLETSRARGQSVLETMASGEPPARVRPAVWGAIQALAADLRDLGERALSRTAGEVVADLLERVRYLDYLRGEGVTADGTAVSRIENVQELLAAAEEFSEGAETPTLVEFLAEVSLSTPIDQWDGRPEAVNLMTVHNAKGLEFRWVLITGLEEGLFPHWSSIDSRDPMEIEEERRLMYVGLTRARERVHLFAAGRRMRFQGPEWGEVSRFVSEIPGELLDVSGTPLGGPPADDPDVFGEASRGPRRGGGSRRRVVLDDEEAAHEESGFAPGAFVRHPDFGPGRVVAVEGAGASLKVTVQFDAGFRKRILAGCGYLRRS